MTQPGTPHPHAGQCIALATGGSTIGVLVTGLLTRWEFIVRRVTSEDDGLDGAALAIVDMGLPDAEQLVAACVDRGVPVLAIAPAGQQPPGAMASIGLPIAPAALHAAVLQCLDGSGRKPIDYDAVRMLWDDPADPGYLRVAGVFIGELDRFAQNLPEFLQADDRRLLERQAHSIKGAAASVGAAQVEDAARALEAAARSGSDILLRQLATALEKTVQPTIRELDSLIRAGKV